MKDFLISIPTKPEYPIKDTIYGKIYKKMRVRIIIFIVLTLLILASYILGQKFPSQASIFTNLTAGFISSLITIFIIDFLLNYDKKMKIKEVNFYNNDMFLLKIRGLMSGILYAFGEISRDEYRSLLFGVPDNKFKNFVEHLMENKRILSLAYYSSHNVDILRLLADHVEYYNSEIKDLISKFVPYPNPILKRRITYDGSWIVSWLTLNRVLLLEKFYNFDELENKIPSGTLSRKLATLSKKEAYEMITQFPKMFPVFQENLSKYCKINMDLLEEAKKQEIPLSV